MSLVRQNFLNLTIEQADLVKKAAAYEQASLSPTTIRTYGSMWKKFEKWCAINESEALPASAETIAIYIASLGEAYSFSTLDATIAAIEYVHEKKGQTIKGDHSLFKRVRRGIRRVHKENQTLKQATPLTVMDIKGICCRLGNDMAGVRDKALLIVTFFGAMRRSEVVSLDLDHLEFNEKGVVVSLLQSKTSDTVEHIYLAPAKDKDICPVGALREWIAILNKAGITSGPVFRSLLKGSKIAGRLSGHGVSAIIKKHFGEIYSGHSPRRGVITEAADAGVHISIMQKLGRWTGAEMPLRYSNRSKGFEESSVNLLRI